MTELQPAPTPRPVAGAAPASADAPAAAARRKHPEEDLQRQVVKFLSVALAGNSTFFHPPNGGRRGFNEAKRFKSMGVLAGLPDLIVINDGRVIGLELKAARGRLSDAQIYCHQLLRRARCPVIVCKSLDDVIAALREAGVPMRVAGNFI